MSPRPNFKSTKRIFAKDSQLIKRQTWSAPDAAAADAIHAAITGSAAAATTVTTAITNPDVPRAVSITPGGTTADVAAGDYVITGTDIDDKVITDTIAIAANASSIQSGSKAFKTVTSILIPKQDGAAATFTIGTLDKLGLREKIQEDSVPSTLVDGTVETTRPTVAASSTVLSSNTIDPNTALDGSKDVVCYYIYPYPS